MANINIDPFLVIDDSGSYQNLHVVTRSFDGGVRVLPYSLAELTASTVSVYGLSTLILGANDISSSVISGNIELGHIKDQLTASYNYLTSSNLYLSSISSSLSSSVDSINNISSSIVEIYSTLTASYDKLSGSYEELTASNISLGSIDTAVNKLTSSADTTYDYLTSSLNTITASLSQSTNYVKQLASYARATFVSSSIFSRAEVSSGKDLAETALIPGYQTTPANNENYLRACVDVLVQNSTDKNCYIKVTNSPGWTISETDYTIKLPPGVVYNSDSQLASMRHVVYVPSSATQGEVSAMMTYNTTLLTDMNAPPLVGINTIYSLAVNNYNFYNTKAVINEWNFQDQGIYNKFVVTGQARIDNPATDTFDIYVTTASSDDPIPGSQKVTINSSTPQFFSIPICNPENANYELMVDCRQGTLNKLGSGRILFADVLIQSSSTC